MPEYQDKVVDASPATENQQELAGPTFELFIGLPCTLCHENLGPEQEEEKSQARGRGILVRPLIATIFGDRRTGKVNSPSV
jgi:hypothetical protein